MKISSRFSTASGRVSDLISGGETRLTGITDLQYVHCTWESKLRDTKCSHKLRADTICSSAYDDIKDEAQASIEEFHARQARTTVPARSIPYALNARPTYVKINEDPAYLKLGGELKPFQLTGLNWLAYSWSKGENGILADEVSG